MTRTLGSALAICHRSGSGSGGGGGTMHKILWSNSIHYCLQSAGPRQETSSKKATLTSERRNTEADSGRGTGFGGRNRIVGGAVIHCRDQSIGVPGRECVRCWLIRVFPAWICSGLAACDGPTSMLLDADRPTALPGRLFERCEALDSNITDLDVPSPGCRAPGGAELGRPTAIAISDAAIPLAYPAPLSSLRTSLQSLTTTQGQAGRRLLRPLRRSNEVTRSKLVPYLRTMIEYKSRSA